jgi:antitoxin VapB
MSLHVKDPEAQRLAEVIAEATGEPVAIVVTVALRERYERLQSKPVKASLEELRAIAKSVSTRAKHPHVDHGEALYNEHGLPR